MERRYAYHVPAALDIDAMKQVCQSLVGTHDFASFTGSAGIRTVREVYKAELKKEDELVCFDIEANSFLHKQVRFIVGAIIRVGLGKLSVSGFKEIMEARIPGLAAPVVAPHGLCLMKVNYSGDKFNKGN
jgi:tRNA pseudouridine38-40 synthase